MPNAHINYTALTHQLYTRYVSYIVHAVQCTCTCLASRTILLSISTFRGHRQVSKSEWLYLSAHTCTVLPDRHENGFLYVWNSSHVDEASRTCTQCYIAMQVTVHSLRWKVASVARQNYYTWPNYASLSLAIPILWDMRTRRMPTYGYYRTLSFSLHSKHCI